MLISAHTGQTSKYNSVEVKLQWQKFIHLLNGASQGNYFLPKSHKFAFLKKKSLQEHLWQPKLQTWLFSTGTYASIGTKLCRYRVWKCYEKYKKKKKTYIRSKWCCFGPRPWPYRPLYGQKNNYKTWLFAIYVLKNFQTILFCQSWENWGQIW